MFSFTVFFKDSLLKVFISITRLLRFMPIKIKNSALSGVRMGLANNFQGLCQSHFILHIPEIQLLAP